MQCYTTCTNRKKMRKIYENDLKLSSFQNMLKISRLDPAWRWVRLKNSWTRMIYVIVLRIKRLLQGVRTTRCASLLGLPSYLKLRMLKII